MSQPTNRPNFSFMEKLEDRVLFDAVPDGSFILPGETHSEPPQIVQHQIDQSNPSIHHSTELILIDAGVENGSDLLASILDSNPDRTYEVRYIESHRSGVDQMTGILATAERPYDAVHVISHGQAGSIQLGSTLLDLPSLNEHANDIASWSRGLSADADLLFYGCDLASNESGKMLTHSLATLTGADVAASTDLTGNAAKGGDWELEHRVGQIEARSFVIRSWSGILATAVDDVNSIQANSTGTTTGNVLNNDFHSNGTITEVHAYAAEVGNAFQLNYGTITINANGSYQYDIDENHQAVIGLRTGDTLEEIVSYQVTDANSSDTGILVITIDGIDDELIAVNDANEVTAVVDPVATGNLITELGAGFDIFDRGLSRLVWEDEYFNGQSVSGTFRVVDGIRVDITTTDPDNAGTANNFDVLHSTNGGHFGYLVNSLNGGVDPNSEITTTFDFDAEVFSLSFILADIDRDNFGTITWQDQFTVTGTNGGVPVDFSTLVAGTVTESPNDTFFGVGSVPASEAHGNVNIVFNGPVDSVTIRYQYGPDLQGAPSGIVGAISDLTWQPPVDVFVSQVNGDSNNVNVPFVGTYGTFLINTDGSYTYTVDDTHPAVIALGAGQTLVDNVPYTLENSIGQTSTALVVMTITGINEAPTIDLDGTGGTTGFNTSYVEGGSPANLTDSDVVVADVDNPDISMESLTITPSSIQDGALEVIQFQGDGGTTISFSLDGTPSTQSIVVNGTTFNVAYDGTTFLVTEDGGAEMPLAALQAFMAGITYQNLDPTPTIGNRTFTFVVNDGDANSNIAVSTVGVTTSAQAAQWSLTGSASVDEGAVASYQLALNSALRNGETAQVNLTLTNLTTSANDHSAINAAIDAAIASYAGPGSLQRIGSTIRFTSDGTGALTPLSINIAATNDAWIEGPESYRLQISSPNSTTGENISVSSTSNTVTTIINDTQSSGGSLDGPGQWAISGPTEGDEGGTAQYIISLTGNYGAGETASVNLNLTDIDTQSNDYANFVSAVAAAAASNPNVSFNSATGVLTFTSAADGGSMPNLVIDLVLNDDHNIEGSEDFQVAISNATSSTGANVILSANTSVVTTINDTQGDGGIDEGPAVWNISGPTLRDEGALAQYTISLSGAFGAGTSVSVDLELDSNTTNANDYANFVAAVNAAVASNPNVTFNAITNQLTFSATNNGDSMADVVIDLAINNDGYIEGTESFILSLGNASSNTDATVSINNGSVETVINDTQGEGGSSDGPGVWSISGPTLSDEGAIAQYQISLNGTFGAGEIVSVDIGLANHDTTSADYGDWIAAVNLAVAANPNVSFNATTGTLTYTSPADGAAMAPLEINLAIVDDVFVEGAEDFSLTLSNPIGSTGAVAVLSPTDFSVRTTINDTQGDGGPAEQATWSINGSIAVDEGGSASYTVSLSPTLQAGENASVVLTLANLETNSADYAAFATAVQNAVSARPDLAFNSTTGVLTFVGNGSPMTDLVINLGIVDDSLVEGDERLVVGLASAASSTGASVAIDSVSNSVTTLVQDTIGDGGAPEEVIWSFGSDQTVDEGASATYVLSLGNGVLQAGERVSVDIALIHIDTDSSDHADFNSAIATAVANYSGAGSMFFNSTTGTITFESDGGPMSDLSISLATLDDAIAEGPETLRVQISNATSSTGAAVSVDAANQDSTTTIDDTTGLGTDELIWSIAGDTDVDEGGVARYRVSIAGTLASGRTAYVDLTLANLETQSADYAAFASAVQTAIGSRTDLSFNSASGRLTLVGTGAAVGDLVIDLSIVNDNLVEGPERYEIGLSNGGSSDGVRVGVDSATDSVVTTIRDTVSNGGPIESALWSLSGDSNVDEGNSIVYTVALSGTLQSGEVATIDLNLQDVETNSADYESFSAAVSSAVSSYNASGPGTMVFNQTTGQLSFTSDGRAMADLTITLDTVDDQLTEGDERLRVQLSNPNSTTDASIGLSGSDFTTTIDDNDNSEWRIGGSTAVDEGGIANYTISLGGFYPAGEVISVEINLADITTQTNDYASLVAAIAAAAASDPDLSFDTSTGRLTYTSPSNGAAMTDLSFSLAITDDNRIEGSESFRIELANPATTSSAPVSIDAAAQQVTTLVNDTQGDGGPADGPAQWAISGPVSTDEGSTAQYAISLAGGLGVGEVVTVRLDLANLGTNASDYGDFLAAVTAAVASNPDVTFDASTGTLTFTSPSDGAVMPTIFVDLPITNDAFAEGTEDFTVTLSAPHSSSGVPVEITPGSDQVRTTIEDTQGVGGPDDGPVAWNLSGPVSVDEGETAQYILSLSGTFGIGESVAVQLNLNEISTNGSDYANVLTAIQNAAAANANVVFNATTGLLTFTSPTEGGSMSDLVIDLPIINDANIEGAESFSLDLTNPQSTTGVNVGVNNASVTTTIDDTQGVGGANDGPGLWAIQGLSSLDEGQTGGYLISLSGNYGAGEIVTVDLSLVDVNTNNADYASFVAAVNAAVAANPNVSFDSINGRLTFTSPSDGASMATLRVDLSIANDSWAEGPEDFRIELSDASSSTGANVGIDSANAFVQTTINDTQGIGGAADGPVQWNLSGPLAGDEGATLTYVVSLMGTLGAGEVATVQIDLNQLTTNANDYGNFVAAVSAAASSHPDVSFNATTGVLTYTSPSDGASMTDLMIELPLTDDGWIEGDEQYRVELTNAGSITGISVGIASGLVTTTISDTEGEGGPSEGPGTWSISGTLQGDEGSTASYLVSLSGRYGIGEQVSVDLGLANIDTASSDYGNFIAAVNAAIAGDPSLDFNSSTGVLTYTSPSDGASMGDIVIDLALTDDGWIEGPEDFQVQLENAVSSTGAPVEVSAGSASVTTTILDTQGVGGPADGPGQWNLSGPVSVDEGGTAQYLISLSGAYGIGEVVQVQVALNPQSTSSNDYGDVIAAIAAAAATNPNVGFNATTGILTFTSPSEGGSMSDLAIDLPITDDLFAEGDESFVLQLSNATSSTGVGATINNAAVTTVIDDSQGVGGIADGPNVWSITGSTTVDEGDVAQFVIGLSGTFGAGEIATVNLDFDALDTNSADYSNLIAAISAAASANPDVNFDSGSGQLTFLSPADGASMTDLTVDVSILLDGLSEGNEDFSLSLSNPGSTTGLTVAVNSTQATVTTQIIDADAANWSISGPVSIDEGGNATYLISLAGAFQNGDSVSVQLDLNHLSTVTSDVGDWIAAVNAAVAGDPSVQFDGTTGTITFTASSDGASMSDLNIVLPIQNDAFIEGNEQFAVELSNPTSAGIPVGISNPSVTSTIHDTQGVGGVDDGPAEWSISGPVARDEGMIAQYRIQLSGQFGLGETAVVVLDLRDIDTSNTDRGDFIAAVNAAVSGRSDLAFNAVTQELTFVSSADGTTMADLLIDVSLTNDNWIEGNESFAVDLSAASSTSGANVGIANASVTTTILDTQGVGGPADGPGQWSISGPLSIDEGGTAQYVIRLSGQYGAGESVSVDVNLNQLDTTAADYADIVVALNNAAAANPHVIFDATQQRLTFTSAFDGGLMSDLVVNLPITNDALVEGPEQFEWLLSNAVSSTGAGVGVGLADRVVTLINDTQGMGGTNDQASWSLQGDTSVDEGGTAVYQLSLDGVLQSGETASVQLLLTQIDTNSSDYAALTTAIQTAISARPEFSFDASSGTLTLTGDGNAMTDLVISLDAIDDSLVEGDEQYRLEIASPSSSTGAEIGIGSNQQVTTTIGDTMGDGGASESVVWNLGPDQTVAEGEDANWILSLSGGVLQAGERVSIHIGLTDGTTTLGDYANFNDAVADAVAAYTGPGTLVFNPISGTIVFESDGNPMSDLSIDLSTVDDGLSEGVEQFVVSISSASSSTGAAVGINSSGSQSVVTIDDTIGAGADEVIWQITGDTNVDEGGSAQYTISLVGVLASGETSSVQLALTDLETQGLDYGSFVTAVQDAIGSRTDLSFNPSTGVLTAIGNGAALSDLTIELNATDDHLIEGDERFSIGLAGATSSSGVLTSVHPASHSVTTTIGDTEGEGGAVESAIWTLVGDTSVNEGSTASLTLALGGVLQDGETATVQIGLTDIDTQAGDYADLATAIQASVASYTGPGTLSFNPTSGVLTFTSDGAPMDDLVIALDTVNDVISEGNERLTIALSNPGSTTGAHSSLGAMSSLTMTIVDDDVSNWSVTGASIGDEGQTVQYTFAVSGTLGLGDEVSVQIDIANLTTTSTDYENVLNAIAAAAALDPNVDFDTATQRLSYVSPADGSAMTPLVVDVLLTDDTIIEGDEEFTIGLSNPVGVGLIVDVDASAASVTTSIRDTQGIGGASDGPGEWSISGPVSIDEGGVAQYTISLTGAFGLGEIATIDLGINELDTDGNDYDDVLAAIEAAVMSDPTLSFDSSTGTLTFTSPSEGASMSDLVFDVAINDDLMVEGSEDFEITLSSPSSSTGANVGLSANGSVTTTIGDTAGVGGTLDSATWSILGSTSVQEGGFASYTLSLDGIVKAGQTVSVDIDINDLDTDPSDRGSLLTAVADAIAGRGDLSFNAATGTLTFTSDGQPMEDLVVTLPAYADQLVEGAEDFQLLLSSPTGSGDLGVATNPGGDRVSTTIETRESGTGNTPPIATDDTARTHVDTSVSGNLLANDGDPDGDPLTINTTPVSEPTHGTVVIHADGSFVYLPDTGFLGTDTFTYEITDAVGNVETATVTIHVVSDTNGIGNDGPIANDDAGIGQKNSAIQGQLLINDSDPNGDSLIINLVPVEPPTNGVLQIQADGSYEYLPNDDFVGVDRFVYEVSDGHGGVKRAVVYLTIFDNPPIAIDDISNTSVNQSVRGNVLTNDQDPNPNDQLTVNPIPVTPPSHGSLLLSADGSYLYTPSVGFVGTDTFEYEVCDEGGNCTTASVTIEVRDTTPNNPPIANDDSTTTFVGQIVSGSLISNDNDPDGDPLLIDLVPVTDPVNGSVMIHPDGTFTYTPAPGFEGEDSFEYQVCDDEGACVTATMTIRVIADLNPGNDAPFANDDRGRGFPNQPVQGNLLANDTDPNGDPLTVSLQPVTPPISGTVVINSDGTYVYTPNPGFVGTDQFEYEVCDLAGQCSTATVQIEIADRPVPNAPPIANDDNASTLANVSVSGSLISNDGDPDGDAITINTTPVSLPSHGVVVIRPDGTFTYTPLLGFIGTDTFEYEVRDANGAIDRATVTLRVSADVSGTANHPPFANDDAGIGQKNRPILGDLLANDSDPNVGDSLTVNTTPVLSPANGTLTINSDGTYLYVPHDDFVGTDRFVYEVCDSNGECDQATVVIAIFDSAPVARDDFANSIVDTPVTGNVLTNDINGDREDDLSVDSVPVTPPKYGTLILNTDGTFEYTPNPGFSGTDFFEYEVCDEEGNCDIGRVVIEIRNIANVGNNPPIANDDYMRVFQGESVTTSLLSNDGDPEGQPLTLNRTPVIEPANGTLEIHADGTYTYTPSPNFIGTDYFVYEICDDAGGCDTALVTIEVVADTNGTQNDPPVGGDDSIIGQKNKMSTGNLLANDVDPNGDPLTINPIPVTAPTNGTLVIQPDGSFTYVPNVGFTGTDRFEYELCDSSNACVTVSGAITIFNEPPIAVDDVFEVGGDSVTGNVLLNDIEPNGDPVTAGVETPPAHGTLVWNTNGTFTYTPGPTYVGSDSFTYHVCDDSGACRTATVTLVTPFAFDAFNNQSIDERSGFLREGVNHQGREVLLSQRIGSLAPEPILAGYAQPGSILVGKIYDGNGAIVGETTTQVNRAGNWVMHFFGVNAQTNFTVMIEHVATEEVEMGNHHFRLTPDTYRALQLGAEHLRSTTIGTILSDAPSNSLETWHQQNQNPLRLL